QLVFALLVGIALWTAPAWQALAPAEMAEVRPLRRAALALVMVTYLQIVCGAIMRHKELAVATRLHVLLAFGVVAAAAWLGTLVLRSEALGTGGRWGVWVLWGLVALQVVLGLETLLTKPRISILVLFTVAAGGWLAGLGEGDGVVLLHTVCATALVAAGASALNQLLERHTDALMQRTENRPLPAGRLHPAEVLVFGLLLGVGGLAYLAAAVRQPLAVAV